MESSLRLTNLPDPLREQIVGNLPTTTVPPADGEPCAICFEASPGDEWSPLSLTYIYLYVYVQVKILITKIDTYTHLEHITQVDTYTHLER